MVIVIFDMLNIEIVNKNIYLLFTLNSSVCLFQYLFLSVCIYLAICTFVCKSM